MPRGRGRQAKSRDYPTKAFNARWKEYYAKVHRKAKEKSDAL